MADRAAQVSLTPLITCQMVYSLPCERVAPFTATDEQEIPLAEEVVSEFKAENEDGADIEAADHQENIPAKEETALSPADKQIRNYSWNSPCLMIVFDDGDFNSALHYVINSLQNPFEKNAVASILLQECLHQKFVDHLSSQLVELDPLVASHPNYLRSIEKIAQINPQIVSNPELKTSPILMYDIPQAYLGDGPTGIITLHIFRTSIEAAEISRKESLPFAFVSIWNERIGDTYHVIADLKIDTIMINCYNVDLQIIRDSFTSKQSDVRISKGYHYETLILNGKRKIIVFPMGTIFSN